VKIKHAMAEYDAKTMTKRTKNNTGGVSAYALSKQNM
jgi:hypothetical protein